MIWSIGRMFMDQDTQYNPECRRLRCMGHVCNISIKAFWFGDSGGTQDIVDVVVVTNETMSQCRQVGPWGNAHNITINICSSDQRKQHLKRLGAETLLHAGNTGRLNSGLSVIQSLLRNTEAVNFFCVNNYDLVHNTLSDQAWVQLKSAVSVHQPFLRSTLR